MEKQDKFQPEVQKYISCLSFLLNQQDVLDMPSKMPLISIDNYNRKFLRHPQIYYSSYHIEHQVKSLEDALHNLKELTVIKSKFQPYAPAFMLLGYCYQFSIFTPQNDELAVAYYRIAIAISKDEPYAPAIYQLGKSYFEGWGVSQDIQQSIKYFQRSAQLGSASAMNELALCYFQGLGVQGNPIEGQKYFFKAMKCGCISAFNNAGYYFTKPMSGAKHFKVGILCLLKSAQYGYSEAMFNLASVMEDSKLKKYRGDQVKKYFNLAKKYGEDKEECFYEENL